MDRTKIVPLLPLIPIAIGAGLMAWLLCFTAPHVHFSGDGAIKEAEISAWLSHGTISSRLDWIRKPDWADELPGVQPLPIGSPFAYDGTLVFPPFFLLASAPFYVIFDYYGLFILPFLSILGLWLLMWRYLRSSGAPELSIFVAMVILIASPLTFYGAIFWEHAPALFFFYLAFFTYRRADKRSGNGPPRSHALATMPFSPAMAAAGISLGLAVAFRPELAVAAVVLFFYAAATLRPFKLFGAFSFGVMAATILFGAVNLVSTGHLLGVHDKQPLLLGEADWAGRLAEYYARLGAEFALQSPVVPAALILSILFMGKLAEHRKEGILLMSMILASAFLLPLMLPNSGGLQIFRRYDLVSIPAAAILAARLTGLNRWAGLSAVLLVMAQTPERLNDWGQYRWAYGDRIRPIHNEIAREAPEIIIVNHTIAALELAHRLGTAPILRIQTPDALSALIPALEKHVDLNRVALVFYQPAAARGFEIKLSGGRVFRAVKMDEGRGEFVLYRLER